MTRLKVLVIDDERPALDELTFLLGRGAGTKVIVRVPKFAPGVQV